MIKIIRFFSKNKLGKLLGSTLLGIGSVIPVTAPFMPAIKQASIGLSGKGNHDYTAYTVALVTIIAMVLIAMGKMDLDTAKSLIKLN